MTTIAILWIAFGLASFRAGWVFAEWRRERRRRWMNTHFPKVKTLRRI